MLIAYLIIGMIFVAFVTNSNSKIRNAFSNTTDLVDSLAVIIVLTWHTISWPIDILRAIIAVLIEEET